MFSGVRPPVGPAEAPQPSGDTTIVGTGLLHQLSAAHSCNLSSDRTQHPWFPCLPNVTRWIPSRRRMAWRVPFRQSILGPQGHGGIDARRSTRRNHARRQGNRGQQEGHRPEGDRVGGGNSVEHGFQESRERGGAAEADGETQRHQYRATAHHETEHAAGIRAERHADAELLRPQRHQVRDHPVDARRREQRAERREQSQKPQVAA